MFPIASLRIVALLLVALQVYLVDTTYIPPEILISSKNLGLVNDSATDGPIITRDINDPNGPERQRINELNSYYRGIYWDTAYPGARPGDDEGGCTVSPSL